MALTRLARSGWNFATSLTLACLLALPGWGLAADEKAQPAPSEQEQPADVMRDVTDLVEVTVNGGLTSTNKTSHSAAVTVKNTSGEDLAGPLVVVVDETGIATLSVKNSDGMLEEDKPYVEFLDKRGTLKAGKSLRTQKIEFTTDEALTLNQRQQFSLKLRVLYLPESARTAKTEKNSKGEDLIEGKKYSEQDFARIATIQEKWTVPILKRGQGNAYGTAIAEDSNGNLVVKVYTQREGIADDLPDRIDGIPVETMVIGAPFRSGPAWQAKPGTPIYVNGVPKVPGTVQPGPEQPMPDPEGRPGSPTVDGNLSGPPGDPTIRFPRPVPIGVSISNVDRLLLALDCYSGTLGCRCVDPLGQTYILTNNHVGAAITNPLIPAQIGITGERIVQTSTADMLPVPCINDFNNVIGVLADWEIIFLWTEQQILMGVAVPSYMDAAVVRTIPNIVQAETPDDGYGAPKRTLWTPRLGTPIQKYGRTTVYTKGQVTGLNVSAMISVLPNLFAYMVKQIEVANFAGNSDINPPQSTPIGGPGDSGSLIVVRRPGHESDRQPVALLFAGGPSGQVDAALCNPLGPILARFNLGIDDGTGTPQNSGVSGTMGGVIGPHDPPSDFK
jgi:hypothetical protein